MSRISFFQRYSQRENHATNNVMLALRYVYENSPRKLQNVLQSLLDENFQIGLTFSQQRRGSDSIPDAIIAQTRLGFYFETKTNGALQKNQIERHIDSIKSADAGSNGSVLVGLSPKKADPELVRSCKEYAKRHEIGFVAITFLELLEALGNEFKEYETAGLEILEDFRAYLTGENLLTNAAQQLVVVPCGQSYEENINFRVYYEPSNRPNKAGNGYLGIYKDMSVRWIGTVRTAIEYDARNPANTSPGNTSGRDIEKIKEVIGAATYHSLQTAGPHRYYFFEQLFETDYRKISKGGMQNRRNFDLTERIGPDVEKMSVEQIAEKLKSETWE